MHGQRIGYIRVSTLDQNPGRQLEGIPVSRVFTDQASGKDTQRPQLDALLGYLRDGDTLVVHSMDRLARNLDDLPRCQDSCRLIGLTQTEPRGRKELCNAALLC